MFIVICHMTSIINADQINALQPVFIPFYKAQNLVVADDILNHLLNEIFHKLRGRRQASNREKINSINQHFLGGWIPVDDILDCGKKDVGRPRDSRARDYSHALEDIWQAIESQR